MKLPFITAALPLLLFTACGEQHNNAVQLPPLPTILVNTAPVQKDAGVLWQEYTTTVFAPQTSIIAAKIAGRVTEINVSLGKRVQKGDVLLRIDDTDLRAALQTAEIQNKQAQQDLVRYQGMKKENAVTLQEFDQVETRAATTQSAVQEMTTMLAHTTLSAPYSGIITAKSIENGVMAMPGTPLLTIANDTRLQLQCEIPEQVRSSLTIGQEMQAQIGSKNIKAFVAEIAPTANQRSRTVLIKLTIPQDESVFIGQFGRLRVPLAGNESLRVPDSAIVQRGQLEIVFIANNNTAHLRLVRTGRSSDGQTVIVSGLDKNEADQVITSNTHQLVDGQPITIQ